MFERFTDRARRVLSMVQEEARLLNHPNIGTEHILFGARPSCRTQSILGQAPYAATVYRWGKLGIGRMSRPLVLLAGLVLVLSACGPAGANRDATKVAFQRTVRLGYQKTVLAITARFRIREDFDLSLAIRRRWLPPVMSTSHLELS